MVKINLLAERKQAKARPTPGLTPQRGNMGQNILLIGILALGVGVAGGWWWKLSSDEKSWTVKHQNADQELKRLEDIRKKAGVFENQKALLERKIQLITELKKRQAVPVRILDHVSRSLPDFLWLDSMGANKNRITISGKATTYNAVSNFYTSLTGSGFFQDVALGRVFEVPEGVSFSLSCNFGQLAEGEGEGGEETTG